MATQVETFLIDETKELVTDIEKLDEWKEKVKELGLTGQEALINPSKPNASPIPFVHLNSEMTAVYKSLCPRREDVKNYSKTPIPLQVLGLIALCEKEGYFKDIEIWHNEQQPDPIAVGTHHNGNTSEKYIIARWGDELRSYPELVKLAKEKIKETVIRKATELKIQVEDAIKNPETWVEKELRGTWCYIGSELGK